MNRILVCALVVMIAVTGTLAQQRPSDPQLIQGSDRFSGTVDVQTKAGAARLVQITLRNWTLRGGQRRGTGQADGLQAFPARGFLMMHLLAGRVRTVINGMTQEWKEGDVWTLPANATMMVEVQGETAVVQTLSMGTAPTR